MKWIVFAALFGGIIVIWIPYPVETVRIGASLAMLGIGILNLIERTSEE